MYSFTLVSNFGFFVEKKIEELKAEVLLLLVSACDSLASPRATGPQGSYDEIESFKVRPPAYTPLFSLTDPIALQQRKKAFFNRIFDATRLSHVHFGGPASATSPCPLRYLYFIHYLLL
jgi:hypothetical protein